MECFSQAPEPLVRPLFRACNSLAFWAWNKTYLLPSEGTRWASSPCFIAPFLSYSHLLPPPLSLHQAWEHTPPSAAHKSPFWPLSLRPGSGSVTPGDRRLLAQRIHPLPCPCWPSSAPSELSGYGALLAAPTSAGLLPLQGSLVSSGLPVLPRSPAGSGCSVFHLQPSLSLTCGPMFASHSSPLRPPEPGSAPLPQQCPHERFQSCIPYS